MGNTCAMPCYPLHCPTPYPHFSRLQMCDESYLVSGNFGQMESVYRQTQWWTPVQQGTLQVGPSSSISGYQLVPRLETHNPARQQCHWPFKCNCPSYTTCYKGYKKATVCNHSVLIFAKNHFLLYHWARCSLLLSVPLALCFVFRYLLLVFPNWRVVPFIFFSLSCRGLKLLPLHSDPYFWIFRLHWFLWYYCPGYVSIHWLLPIKPLEAGLVDQLFQWEAQTLKFLSKLLAGGSSGLTHPPLK